MSDFTNKTVLVLLRDNDRFVHAGAGRQFLDHMGINGTDPIPDSVDVLQIYTDEGLRLEVGQKDGEAVLRRCEDGEKVEQSVLMKRIERVLATQRRLQELANRVTIPTVVEADLKETLKTLTDAMDLQPPPSRGGTRHDPTDGDKYHDWCHSINYYLAHPFG
jgi:hypothetical protein